MLALQIFHILQVDTPGTQGDMVKQLKAVTKYTKSNTDLLVYSLSTTPGSKLVEDKGIMQIVYGADIWPSSSYL